MDLFEIKRDLEWLKEEANLEKALYSEHGALEHKNVAERKVKRIVEFIKKNRDKIDEFFYKDALNTAEKIITIFENDTLNAARMFIAAHDYIKDFITTVKGILSLLEIKSKSLTKDKGNVSLERGGTAEQFEELKRRIKALEKRVESLERAILNDELRRSYLKLIHENIELSLKLEKLIKEKKALEKRVQEFSS